MKVKAVHQVLHYCLEMALLQVTGVFTMKYRSRNITQWVSVTRLLKHMYHPISTSNVGYPQSCVHVNRSLVIIVQMRRVQTAELTPPQASSLIETLLAALRSKILNSVNSGRKLN